MERIGILGGTFDPIHSGHLGIASEAREKFRLDRVLFVPANISPHKRQRTITPPHHRLEMIRLAIQSEPAFCVSEIEINRAGISYTIDTLESLERVCPDAELFLILGADAFKDMATWKEYRRLLEKYHILVATRPGHALENQDDLVRELGDHVVLPQASEESCQFTGKGKTRSFQHRRTGKNLILFQITPCPVSSSEIRENVRNKKEIKNMLPVEVENYIMMHQLYQAESSPRI